MTIMSFRRQDRRLRHHLRRTKGTFVMGCLLVLAGLLFSGQMIEVPPLGSLGATKTVSDRIAEQVSPPPAAPPAGLTDRLAAIPGVPNGAPLLLTYHNVWPNATNPYAVTPSLFATQMRLLADAGYRTIRADDLVAWLNGRALPAKSVFLSFDDADGGVWKYAEPILAAHRFSANLFVITDRVGRGASYLTWPEIKRLAATGRWDIQAHTRHGHRYLPVNAAGAQGAFLTSRAWLPEGRRETPAEYQRRVTDDLNGNIADVRAHGFPRPSLFAFPFSEAASSDTRTTAFIRSLTSRLFAASLLDDATVAANSVDTVADRRPYRLNVVSTDSLETFVTKVERSTPLPMRATRALTNPTDWVPIGGRPDAAKGVTGNRATLSVPARGWQEIAYAPSRTGFWRDYTTAVTVTGLSDATNAVGGLAVRVGTPGEVGVSVSASWMSIRMVGADKPVREGKLPVSPTHKISMRVTGRRVVIRVDAFSPVTLRVAPGHGGPGLFVSGGPKPARASFTGLTLTPLAGPAHKPSRKHAKR